MENKLEAFEEGQLCYVVRRSYKGEGEPVLILHEAHVNYGDGEFYYGHGRHWVVSDKVINYSEPTPVIPGETKEESLF